MSRAPEPPARPQPSQAPSTDEVLDQHRDALKERFPLPDPQVLQRRRGGRTARVVLPTLGLVVTALLLIDPAWQVQDHRTAVGERRELDLADGSHLLLDAGTHLQVRRHLRSRQVVLMQGRARFEVQHSGWRRFEVDAGPVHVRNYGTVFDVDRQGELSEVTLWRGDVGVRVEGGTSEQRLAPGQRLLAQPGSISPPEAIDPDQADWTHGRLQFDQLPLAEVLRVLQRYHDRPIVLDDPTLGPLKVSGVFDADRAETAVSLLPDILPVQVHTAGDGSLHLRRRD
ncbi:TPA: FecR domain-containing protein [Stenotrophomonas maltophilia]|nr:FecR domain-containing protein [Stenotrophomonas maltophilia]HDS1155479.1 FecR domain-containing protein [Stenotrophomonas maltophilia]HDS1166313.1 FecR domain-containing protein [Stenotrophomonas maltophilia]HDS1172093.1 FecR domain-containing protein [Stenotrophomonas maltophilia]HDS1176791.1 FecR domain-containing protein [Stenotrophomonas maltophilia]